MFLETLHVSEHFCRNVELDSNEQYNIANMNFFSIL
jgi:hypothetical protein